MVRSFQELVFLMLQFLEEQGYTDTARLLEEESGLYFNMNRFEGMVSRGEWEEADKYPSGFTNIDANLFSRKMFFEIRKYNYYEALDRHDRSKALEILHKDLKAFSNYDNGALVKGLARLLPMDDFREIKELSRCARGNALRAIAMKDLKKLIERSEEFKDKLESPNVKNLRLIDLMNQSLYSCHEPNVGMVPPSAPRRGARGRFQLRPRVVRGQQALGPLLPLLPPKRPHKMGIYDQPFQQATGPLPPSFPHWMANASTAVQTVSGMVYGLPLGVVFPPNTEHPIPPPDGNMVVDCHSSTSEDALKRPSKMGTDEESNSSSAKANLEDADHKDEERPEDP